MNNQLPKRTQIKPNGEIVFPVKGTIKWVDGKACGIWGIDHRIKPMLLTEYGTLRDLNALERSLYADLIQGVVL